MLDQQSEFQQIEQPNPYTDDPRIQKYYDRLMEYHVKSPVEDEDAVKVMAAIDDLYTEFPDQKERDLFLSA
ncbi:hypothetical protein ACFL3C_05400, partial [Patescibacteria group bacterium]